MHLYGREPVELDVELALAADFRPMLALARHRGTPAPPRVHVEADRRAACASRRAAATACSRTTTVTADPAPDERRRRAAALRRSRCAPGEARDVDRDLPARRERSRRPGRERARGLGRRTARRRCARTTSCSTACSSARCSTCRCCRSSLDGQAYYAAGIPWFATLFGRDSLITAMQMAAWSPEMAEQTLRVLAGRLGRRVDPVHEEEPGKVIHELRVGELAALDVDTAHALLRHRRRDAAVPLPARRARAVERQPRPVPRAARRGRGARSAGSTTTATTTATACSTIARAAPTDCATRAGATPTTACSTSTARRSSRRSR